MLPSGELFLLRAKTFAGAHRLLGINFCSSLQTQHIIISTQPLLCIGFTMPGSETLRALRLLSRGSGGLLSGPEAVTVWIFCVLGSHRLIALH